MESDVVVARDDFKSCGSRVDGEYPSNSVDVTLEIHFRLIETVVKNVAKMNDNIGMVQ